jgi:hypothetical protein
MLYPGAAAWSGRGSGPDDEGGQSGGGGREPSFDDLPVAGLSRRRVGLAIGVVITAWVVIVFARQVGDGAAAQARADRIRGDNAVLAAQVAALQQERSTIQEQGYVAVVARSFGLGEAEERPFSLAPGAPPLPSDAPGSASLRAGTRTKTISPLESWLSLLFGPTP